MLVEYQVIDDRYIYAYAICQQAVKFSKANNTEYLSAFLSLLRYETLSAMALER